MNIQLTAMTAFFLAHLRELFGENFIDNTSVKEAFTQNNDMNRPLAVIGDSVLNLVVNYLAFSNSKNPIYIDRMRKKFADKKTNQKLLNEDKEFVQYLVNNRYTMSPIGGIGLEKADRFYEAVIGAVYVEKGFEEAEKFVCLLLKTSKDFLEEFSEVSMTCT